MNITKKPIIIPQTICFRVTRECNMQCPFCQAPSVNELDMSFDYIVSLVKKLKQSGVESIKYTGGEPYVRKDFDSILSATYNLGVLPTVCTNGILISDENIAFLVKNHAKVKISLHGVRGVHDFIVGREVESKIISNINRLINAGVPVSLHTLVTQQNIKILPTLIDDAIAMGIKKMSLIAFVPRGRGAGDGYLQGIRIKSLKSHYKKLYEKYKHKVDLRLLDFSKPYYVIESDASMWIQQSSEAEDTLLTKNILDSEFIVHHAKRKIGLINKQI